MGFETPDPVFFQIRPQHRNEEVREVIPRDYQGVMSTDRSLHVFPKKKGRTL
jgi:hypothetical protein